jgi:UDP-perosamine 4-acetyltransferase
LKTQVVVIGGGGHARVILDMLEQRAELEVVGFTSREHDDRTTFLSGLPNLGTDAILFELFNRGVRHAFIAIGDNRRRATCFRSVQSMGFSIVNAISTHAVISPRATLGTGVAVMPGAIINAGAALEDGVIVNSNASIDHDCVIGAFAHIAPSTALAGNVTVGGGALLGVGSRVIPGIRIGRNATVAAGAVVIEDLGADLLAVGVPATIKTGSGKRN